MSKKIILLFLFLSGFCKAQITIRVISVPSTTSDQARIYLAGNMNGWNPGDNLFELKKNVLGIYAITLPESDKPYEFKFTQGNWGNSEIDQSGADLRNRVLPAFRDTIVNLSIAAWKGNGGQSVSNTRNKAFLLSEHFPSKYLNKERKIWIYLPQDYALRPNKKYPVMYMQDGQNLFEESTSANGEWQVDETLVSLEVQGDSGVIVVGIEHGGVDRIDEYIPWVKKGYGGGAGDAYMNFVANELKPIIDRLYRTKSDRENTAIMGSSLGGLISLYALFRYDSTFSKFGIFSPALWIADSIYLLPKLYSHQRQTRIYLMSGLLESASQVQEIYNFRDSLFKHGFSRNAVRCVIKDDGIHSEWFWKREFAACYQWLFAPPSAEERNKEIKKSDFDFELTPTSYQLNVRTNGLSGNSKVDVLDEKGILLVRKTIGESGSLHLKQLRKGKYTVKIINGNLTSSKTFEKK